MDLIPEKWSIHNVGLKNCIKTDTNVERKTVALRIQRSEVRILSGTPTSGYGALPNKTLIFGGTVLRDDGLSFSLAQLSGMRSVVGLLRGRER
ncbi:MAG: hypothetical protein HGA24_02435 [Candidatus Aminicenantes bacterium]|nr:hypothetical protein [Candidatus Aminicenantes bacterium]